MVIFHSYVKLPEGNLRNLNKEQSWTIKFFYPRWFLVVHVVVEGQGELSLNPWSIFGSAKKNTSFAGYSML